MTLTSSILAFYMGEAVEQMQKTHLHFPNFTIVKSCNHIWLIGTYLIDFQFFIIDILYRHSCTGIHSYMENMYSA